MKIVQSVCLTVFMVFMLAGPAASDPTQLSNIPLEWKPTKEIISYGVVDLTVYKNVQFMIKPFSDARKKPAEIGINIEKKRASGDLVVTTKDNVAEWVADRFSKILTSFDVDAVKTGGAFALEADIIKFFVTEKATYKAEVALKVRLFKNNTLLWDGIASGSATRFGKSYRAENYYEALTNATIYTVLALLNDEGFKRAVQKSK